MHIRYPYGPTLPDPRCTHSGVEGTPTPNRDLGAELFPRDKLECPAQGELLRVLGRCPSLNQNATAIFLDDQLSDAVMGFLPNSLLDLLDESFHEFVLLGSRYYATLPAS